MLLEPAKLSVALPWIVSATASIAAACFDLRSRRIPDLLTFPLLFAGMIYAAATGGWGGLGYGALGCLLMAAPFFLLFCFAGGGAGDAKLMGAIGMWLGLPASCAALVCVLLCGVLLGIVWTVRSGKWVEVAGNVLIMSHVIVATAMGRRSARDASEALPDHRNMVKMPYGLAICAGICAAAVGVHIWHA